MKTPSPKTPSPKPPSPKTLKTVPARIRALRARLEKLGLDGFLLPRADRHQGEMVPACDERLAWATGFSGSFGMALILKDRAGLVVDGRYELQAAAETDGALFEVVPIKEQEEWVKAAIASGARVGFDPWLLTPDAAEGWRKRLAACGAALEAMEENPIDAIWTDRPAPPDAPARAHPAALAGLDAAGKRRDLAATLAEEKIDATVLTLPDAIAWLLNIRGADIPHTPVTLAFAILAKSGAVRVFTAPEKFDAALRRQLGKDVSIEPWEAFDAALRGLSGKRVAVEKASAPCAVADILQQAGAELLWRRDPTSLPKARKNAAEIEGARAAQKRDGAALCETLAWIERRTLGGGNGGLTELEVAEELTRRRQETAARLGSAFVDESFSPIVGFGPNGAIVHYRVSEATSLAVEGDGLLLIDSGGQYPDGTTDVTRTVAIGEPTAEMRAIFTRVLKGMIAISRLVFPKGIAGRDIDAFARRALWEAGLDYDHGTGHGVGSFLGVHEGPQRISRISGVALEEGMILSNEPGCYLAGKFGVRIENLILVDALARPAPLGPIAPLREMRRFETLTLAPIDRRLIDLALLDAGEREWLDAYHARVLKELKPLLPKETAAWLKAACAPL